MGFWKYVLGTPRNYALTDVKIEVFAKQHRNTSGLGSEWVNIVEKN